ncbi:MAG: hypothetical protein NTU71_03700 [Verrucomicrobia bacterium]|jgi:hypothetical protein|nr:hypothetical protein [Verrucomicrobiota bacterium]
MKFLPRALLLICALLGAGCAMPDAKRDADDQQRRLMDDSDERKARLQARGTLSPQEYEAMALKMGWTTKGAPGLPPPPTTEELEKRVKAAETNR